jgi:hypothetical protein
MRPSRAIQKLPQRVVIMTGAGRTTRALGSGLAHAPLPWAAAEPAANPPKAKERNASTPRLARPGVIGTVAQGSQPPPWREKWA